MRTGDDHAAGGHVRRRPDKTIVGIGASSGITGGGLNLGLPVSNATSPPANAVHNVIIQNLMFRSASDDSINVQMFSHHVWIDHNDLAQGFDGLIDIKRGSSYVTCVVEPHPPPHEEHAAWPRRR